MRTNSIAIITSSVNGSPRVLGETLVPFIKRSGHNAVIFYKAKALKRLLPHKRVNKNYFIWLLYRLIHYFGDFIFYRKVSKMDAVIICDCSPNAFYRSSYDIKKFKKRIRNRPVIYYAVQYLMNSPTIVKKLRDGGHDSIERYDWHLTVSAITELRGIPAPPWSQLGMNLVSTGLKPVPKEQLLAIVDFERPGYESYRKIQIQALEATGIPYISLEREYSLSDIRDLYKKASIFFIQFPEAFGLPIAECLACGSFIGTPSSAWPMAWRLDESPEVHGPGQLPDCFIVYTDLNDLVQKLKTLRQEFDANETPKKVFQSFYNHYRTFYEGNSASLIELMEYISSNKLGNYTLKFHS